jgi:hypothetical protein
MERAARMNAKPQISKLLKNVVMQMACKQAISTVVSARSASCAARARDGLVQ